MSSLRKKLIEKKEIQKELAAKKTKLLKRDAGIATASPEGLNFMKYIFGLTGYSKILIVGNPATGDIHDRGTLYNNARRSLWLEIRQLIPRRTLKKIEYEELNLNVEEL